MSGYYTSNRSYLGSLCPTTESRRVLSVSLAEWQND
jgi:hypothetical protein